MVKHGGTKPGCANNYTHTFQGLRFFERGGRDHFLTAFFTPAGAELGWRWHLADGISPHSGGMSDIIIYARDMIGLLGKRTNAYTEHPTLNSVNLDISRGEKVAPFRRNGAGKSTQLMYVQALQALFAVPPMPERVKPPTKSEREHFQLQKKTLPLRASGYGVEHLLHFCRTLPVTRSPQRVDVFRSISLRTALLAILPFEGTGKPVPNSFHHRVSPLKNCTAIETGRQSSAMRSRLAERPFLNLRHVLHGVVL